MRKHFCNIKIELLDGQTIECTTRVKKSGAKAIEELFIANGFIVDIINDIYYPLTAIKSISIVGEE